MEIIEKYTKELADDCQITMLNLRDAQMRLPGVKHKWIARLINHKIELGRIKKMIVEAKNTIVERQIKENKVAVSRPTLERMAEENPTVLKMREKYEEHEYAVMYLEKVEQILRNVTFDVKNLTEIMKLEQL